MRVNLIRSAGGPGGITRYVDELTTRLGSIVDFVPCQVGTPGLGWVPLVRHLPFAVEGRDAAAPTHFTQIVGAGALLARNLAPSVVTAHDLGPLVWPPEAKMLTLFGRVLLHLHFRALPRATRVVTLSSVVADTLVSKIGVRRERIDVVPLGVDHSVFTPRRDARRLVEQRLGIGGWDGTRTLLVVGSELPRKNLDTLLEALRVLRAHGQPVRLIKAGAAGGATWRARTIAEAERLGVGEHLFFVDQATDDDLALLYSAADVYVCVSHVEGFGLPAVEAMACGAPIVVSTAGSLPEVVGDAGLVVDARHAAPVVEALNRVLSDQALIDTLREAALRRAPQFNWQRTADETLGVYRGLAS